MGTWSHQPFGNDDANDWAYGLEEVNDLSLIEDTLNRVLEADEYLEAPEASEAIAAIEVIAKLLGKGTQTDSYTETVDDWVTSISIKPTSELITKAKIALERVLGENSELRVLWEETNLYQEWLSSVESLRRDISA